MSFGAKFPGRLLDGKQVTGPLVSDPEDLQIVFGQSEMTQDASWASDCHALSWDRVTSL